MKENMKKKTIKIKNENMIKKREKIHRWSICFASLLVIYVCVGSEKQPDVDHKSQPNGTIKILIS